MTNEHLNPENLEVPLYIADSNSGSRPHIPAEDATRWIEMQAQEAIQLRFGDDPTNYTTEDAMEILTPDRDSSIINDLLNPSLGSDDVEVLQRAIEVITIEGKEMIGWVALYRSSPQRLERFKEEGILDLNADAVNPILELSYARHSNAPGGLMENGVCAELYRFYDLARKPDLPTTSDSSYNELCPLSIIATVDLDNVPSIKLLNKLGFKERGISKYETLAEVEDTAEFIDKDTLVFVLDWDLFMLAVDKKVIDSARQRNLAT